MALVYHLRIYMIEQNFISLVPNELYKQENLKDILALTGDIYENGILLTGGGSLLDNMDVVIERATGLKVKYAEEPLSSVALGSGKVMKNIKTMKDTLSTPYGRH